MTTISACLIVKDEVQHLAACLNSVRGVVDEIVVVDTGSTDGTPALAQSLGADVHHHVWTDDFAAARNVSLACATSDWVFVLDADEALHATSRLALRSTLAATSADALTVIRRNLSSAGDVEAVSTERITRLFRNRPAYCYEGIIHEQVRPSIERAGGRIADSPLVLMHYGYTQTEAQGTDRAQRNLHLLRKALAGTPADPYLHYQLGVTLHALGEPGAARRHLQEALRHGADRVLDRGGMVNLHLKLAQIALAADAYGEAVAQARRCLALAPDRLAALYVGGLALVFLGRPAEALPLLQRARLHLDLRPGDAAELDQVLAHCRQTR